LNELKTDAVLRSLNGAILDSAKSQGSEMINRKLLAKRLHESYHRDVSLKEWDCFYCGAPADTVDHCPPLAMAESVSASRILYRCCRLCNSSLGGAFLVTALERCEHLRARYSRRWHRDIEMPHWTTEEIESLDGSLKAEIIKAMKRKERAINVLSNLQRRIDELWEGTY